MLTKFLCWLLGHRWLFLPPHNSFSSLATCERCLKRERLADPDMVPPPSVRPIAEINQEAFFRK